MMTLEQKVAKLKADATQAYRLAAWYERAGKEHGWSKLEAFYLHKLHLNGIEVKGVEWEGLKLSRQPSPSEAIAVKGVAQTQDSAKSAISDILLQLRADQVSDGLKRIERLPPQKYHTLVLQVPAQYPQSLNDRLIAIYRDARGLVQRELERQKFKQDEDDEFDEAEELTGVTLARVTNDVQARIIAAAARAALLGLTGAALIAAISSEVQTGSISYIDRTATGLANRTIAIGRTDEAESHRDDWERVEYSAILDANVCGPCAAEDGQEASDEADLQPVPNPECEGGDWCRCFHVYVRA